MFKTAEMFPSMTAVTLMAAELTIQRGMESGLQHIVGVGKQLTTAPSTIKGQLAEGIEM